MSFPVDDPILVASMRAAVVASDPEYMLRDRDVALARLSKALLAHLSSVPSLNVCRHAADQLGAGAPLAWAPEQLAINCLPCLFEATVALVQQDPHNNRCATCDRSRSYELRQVIVAAGPVLIYAAICRRCRRLQQDPPYDAVGAAVRVCAHLASLLHPSPGGDAA